MLTKEESAKFDRIRKNIGDRQIIRMVPPVEPAIQTEDEESISFLISLVDSLQKRSTKKRSLPQIRKLLKNVINSAYWYKHPHWVPGGETQKRNQIRFFKWISAEKAQVM